MTTKFETCKLFSTSCMHDGQCRIVCVSRDLCCTWVQPEPDGPKFIVSGDGQSAICPAHCGTCGLKFSFWKISTIRKMMTQLLLWPLLTQCILATNDCHWLRIIYGKMGGDVSEIPDDCCEMEGVRCNREGQVVIINWSNKDLEGFIPSEIGNLVNLKSL